MTSGSFEINDSEYRQESAKHLNPEIDMSYRGAETKP